MVASQSLCVGRGAPAEHKNCFYGLRTRTIYTKGRATHGVFSFEYMHYAQKCIKQKKQFCYLFPASLPAPPCSTLLLRCMYSSLPRARALLPSFALIFARGWNKEGRSKQSKSADCGLARCLPDALPLSALLF